MRLLHRALHKPRSFGLVIAVLLGVAACSESTGPSDESFGRTSASAGLGDREVTIDFSAYGSGKEFEPDFFRSDGVRFPPQACGPAGCTPWLVGFVQGDEALTGDNRFGPVTASFTRPVSDLSLLVAPSMQGTATYVLRAYAVSGQLLATASVTVTEDFGDPANTGFGYFAIGLAHLPRPASRFTLENIFVRSSFPEVDQIPYGIRSISYRHWGLAP